MARFAFFAFAAAMLIATSADAGKYNKKISVGDNAPAWSGLEGTDGKKHALADLKGKDVAVIVFTCNSCPIAESYEDRIIAFANKHAGPDSKVAVVAINSNTIPEDKLDKMKERAAKKKFPFPYIFDATQQIAKAYGASYTPEFVVLDKDRKVVYMGAMDDKSPPSDATKNFLEESVAAALAGKAGPAETVARGCKIRFVTKREN